MPWLCQATAVEPLLTQAGTAELGPSPELLHEGHPPSTAPLPPLPPGWAKRSVPPRPEALSLPPAARSETACTLLVGRGLQAEQGLKWPPHVPAGALRGDVSLHNIYQVVARSCVRAVYREH